MVVEAYFTAYFLDPGWL